MVNGVNQLFFVKDKIMEDRETLCWRALNQCLEHRVNRERKKLHACELWLPWFKKSWWDPRHSTTYLIWIEWAEPMLGLSNGLIPSPFSVAVDPLGLALLGLSKQSMMLWSWAICGKKQASIKSIKRKFHNSNQY